MNVKMWATPKNIYDILAHALHYKVHDFFCVCIAHIISYFIMKNYKHAHYIPTYVCVLSEFFETSKVDFWIFQNFGLRGAESQKFALPIFDDYLKEKIV